MPYLHRPVAQPHHHRDLRERLPVIVRQHDDVLQFFRQLVQCRRQLTQCFLAQQLIVNLAFRRDVLIRLIHHLVPSEIVDHRIPRDGEDPGTHRRLLFIIGVILLIGLLKHIGTQVFRICPALHPGCDIPHYFAAVCFIYLLPVRSCHRLDQADSYASSLYQASPPLPQDQLHHRSASVRCRCTGHAPCR